uniref:Uncharacterized protein n=1 Tax=Aegilops tauschii subsp. strangulata TaxID=200361 RepID=A0A453H2M3_AEGTS
MWYFVNMLPHITSFSAVQSTWEHLPPFPNMQTGTHHTCGHACSCTHTILHVLCGYLVVRGSFSIYMECGLSATFTGIYLMAAHACPPPLGCAALCGEFVAARYLLNHGADPNKIDGTGFAPLHCAAKNG